MVEMAIIVPLVLMLLSVAVTGWSAMEQGIRLSSAARAGALKAANDLAAGQGASAWNDATVVVNQEENVSNVYQDTNPAGADYVKMTKTADTLNGSGTTINVVTIAITNTTAAVMPFVWDISVNTSATARYS